MSDNSYGILSDKQLLEFLAEIKDEDEELKDEEDSAIKQGPLLSNRPRGSRTTEINQMAFRQTDLDLNSVISNDDIRLLISLTVAKHTKMINRYATFINARLTKLLKPFIPVRLLQVWEAYPNTFRTYPGFLYRASQEYGGGKVFWATPNIPYYIEQGTEQKLIANRNPAYLYTIDELVKKYHDKIELRTDKEIENAEIIIYKGIRTYFDLLRTRPLWFELLYNELFKK